MFAHKHLLDIKSLSKEDIFYLFNIAKCYKEQNTANSIGVSDKGEVDSISVLEQRKYYGKTLINLFFENSTRTRTSFELAGKRLGMDVINMDISTSSTSKGETLIDTAVTLNAMNSNFIVIRHSDSGAAELLSQKVNCSVINAGDGWHEHPTQALLDGLTIYEKLGDFKGLKVVIAGDILHSRVARSNIALLSKLGADITVSAPATLLPKDISKLGVKVDNFLDKAIINADIIMMLRVQKERMSKAFFPNEREFSYYYGLDTRKLDKAKPTAFVMHPGPMNRGLEIDSAIADNPERSLILQQVESGVAIRQAVLEALSS